MAYSLTPPSSNPQLLVLVKGGSAPQSAATQQLEFRAAPQYSTPQTITDANGNTWGINISAQVTLNGTALTDNSQVGRIVYSNNQMWRNYGGPGSIGGTWASAPIPAKGATSVTWTTGSDPRPAGLALRVANFLGIFGVNTAPNYGGIYDNGADMLTALKYLNFNMIRGNPISYSSAEPYLNTNGVRFNWICQNGGANPNTPNNAYSSDLIEGAVTPYGTASIFTIEIANESNATCSNSCNNGNCPLDNASGSLAETNCSGGSGPQGLSSAQAGANQRTNCQQWATNVRGNSALANAILIGPSMWVNGPYPSTAYLSAMGDLTQVGVNMGCWHPYCGGQYGVQPRSVFAAMVTEINPNYPGRPIHITETGYSVPGNGSDTGQIASALGAGKMLINALCAAWELGCCGIDIFSLYNNTGEGYQLFNENSGYAPYEQATIIHNFTTPLVDSGSTALTFAPGICPVQVTAPSGGYYFVLAHSDGITFDIVFRDEQQVNSSGSDVTPPALTWTFTATAAWIGGTGSGGAQGFYDPVTTTNANAPTTPIAAQSSGYSTTATTQGYAKVLKIIAGSSGGGGGGGGGGGSPPPPAATPIQFATIANGGSVTVGANIEELYLDSPNATDTFSTYTVAMPQPNTGSNQFTVRSTRPITALSFAVTSPDTSAIYVGGTTSTGISSFGPGTPYGVTYTQGAWHIDPGPFV